MRICPPSRPDRLFLPRLAVLIIVLVFFIVIVALGCSTTVAISLAGAATLVAQTICEPGSVPWRHVTTPPAQVNA